MAKRSMAGLSGSVIELSNYLEQRISQKSSEYAKVISFSNSQTILILIKASKIISFWNWN